MNEAPAAFSQLASAPVPRKRPLGFTLMLLPLAAFALTAPLLFLVSGDARPSPAALWMYFKDGGVFMWVITFVQLLLAVALLVFGALMVRGTRVPASILFVLSLVPFALGVTGVIVGHGKIIAAIQGDLVDPSQKARIFAAGLAEVGSLGVYGGVASAALMYTTAVIAVMSVAVMDPRSLGRARPGLFWGICIFLVLLVAAGCAYLRMRLEVPILALDGLLLFGVLTSGPFAAAAGWRLPILAAHRNDGEAGPAFRLAVVAAFALAAAMIFVDRAAMAAAIRGPLGALSSETTDAEQRVAILRAAVVSLRGRPLVMLADALACVVVFAVAFIAGRAARRKLSIGGVVAAVVAGLVAGFAVLVARRVDADVREIGDVGARARKSIAANGVAVPVLRSLRDAETLAQAPGLLVKADGALVDDRVAAGSADRPRVDIASDGAVSFEAFVAHARPALLASTRVSSIGIVASTGDRGDPADLGPYGPLVGSELFVLPVTLNATLATGLPAPSLDAARPGADEPRRAAAADATAIAVLPDGEVARLSIVSQPQPKELITAIAETFPLIDTPAAAAERQQILKSIRERYPTVATLLLAPAPAETMARVAAMIDALGRAQSAPRVELVLTGDRASLDATLTQAARFTVSDVKVTGALGPEVVTRLLRSNRSLFVGCRAAVNKPGADAPAEVTLRFTIEPTGKVSRPSAIADRAPWLGPCIQKVASEIAYPEQAGPRAAVSAKLVFR